MATSVKTHVVAVWRDKAWRSSAEVAGVPSFSVLVKGTYEQANKVLEAYRDEGHYAYIYADDDGDLCTLDLTGVVLPGIDKEVCLDG